MKQVFCVMIMFSLGMAASWSHRALNEDDGVPHTDCHSLLKAGYTTNGTYRLTLNETTFLVPCEFYGGLGDTVFLSRWNGLQRWDRYSYDYEYGFGVPVIGEFFMGLSNIHHLTKYGSYGLVIKFQDWEGNSGQSINSAFSVAGPDSGYRLFVGGYYSGDVGNDIAYNNGMEFYTLDIPDPAGCVREQRGGWWYRDCTKMLPTGRYYRGGYYTTNKTLADGIYWESFRGDLYSLRKLSMALRPSYN